MVAAILGTSIELSLCLPAEPPNLRTSEPPNQPSWRRCVPCCRHSRCPISALILSWVVLSQERGVVVVTSRCLLRRPSTGIALPAERNSALTVDGVQKHPAKGLCEPVCRVWPDSLGHEW